MREDIREHHVAPIHLSRSYKDNPTTDTSTTTPIRRTTTMSPMMSMDVSLPSVTLENSETARRLRSRYQRRRILRMCTGCAMRIFLLLIAPWVIYTQFERMVGPFLPTTTSSTANIARDYSTVESASDLNSAVVAQTCFTGLASCPCVDPLIPIRGDHGSWSDVLEQNLQLVQSKQAVDVVFFGDSITEGWRGTAFGIPIDRSEGAEDVFARHFSKEQGGSLNGLALGIAGDRCPNLLWRLENGELPTSLNPKVFVVLIGTNDIGNTWCSPELVLIGILRITEEILARKPYSVILLHGLLPRTFDQDGYVARGGSVKPSVWGDIQSINVELQAYATNRERVNYFNTDVFFVDPDASEEDLRLNDEIMPDYLHPSATGYDLWAEKISAKLGTILHDVEEGAPRRNV